MLPIVITVLALILILYMIIPKVANNNIVRYENYVIDEDGILVYTRKNNDLQL